MTRRSRFGEHLGGTNGATRARLCRLRRRREFGPLMAEFRVERITLLRGRAVSPEHHLGAGFITNDLGFSLTIGSSQEPNDPHCRL